MAEIKPFRAWRYNQQLSKQIDALTSPLFDVVSEQQLIELYETDYNSIHLSVPKASHTSAENTKKKVADWKKKGIIVQDSIPGIYVYYQYFTLSGSPKEYCRRGFILNSRLYDWHEGVILRHENTMPRSVNDRVEVLESTQINASPTHGLYTDPEFTLEKYMDESMANPIYETEDYQGVRDVLSVIHDAKTIRHFINLLKDKKVILADGHHRYQGSLTYMQKRKENNPYHTGSEGYNFHLMYLTNTEAHDLRILPTHRLICGWPDIEQEKFLKKAEEYFFVKHVANPHDINEIILGKKRAFGVLFKDNAFKIRLKPEVLETMTWNFPDEIKALDLTVLHYFVIEKILGIKGKDQRDSDNIVFERNFANCLTQVWKNQAQLALITREISMEEIKKVCYSGYTLPQKSTYFYPKVISGFLFSSIKDDEFKAPAYSGF